MKRKIFCWMRENIMGLKDGEIMPFRWRWVSYLFYPILSIRFSLTADPRYEAWNDMFYIFGMRYTGEFFRHFSFGSDDVFQIVGRQQGVPFVTIKRIGCNCDGCPHKKITE